MKKLLSIAILLLSLSATAQVNWFPVYAQATYFNGTVTARVFNNYGRPIFCRLTAYGLDANYRTWISSYVNGWIRPGFSAQAYVYGSFIQYNGNAQCRF